MGAWEQYNSAAGCVPEPSPSAVAKVDHLVGTVDLFSTNKIFGLTQTDSRHSRSENVPVVPGVDYSSLLLQHVGLIKVRRTKNYLCPVLKAEEQS